MLLGYDQSGAVNILTTDGTDGATSGARELARLPASAAAGVDGAAVNITIGLRELAASEYTALNVRAAAAATQFRVEWTLGFPEFPLGDLAFRVRQSVGPARQVKQACRVATVANIADLTSTSTTIDGVTFVAADVNTVGGRIAVVVQTTGAENGIYRIASITGANMRLVRAQDFDESTEVLPLTQIPVSDGTINPPGTTYEISNTIAPIIGTTALTFNRIPPAGTGAVTDIRNDTGGAFAAGDLVVVSGWNAAQTRPRISLVDADSVTAGRRRATGVLRGALADTTNGQMYRSFRLTAVNTAAAAVGDPVYASVTGTTTNTWTLTAPPGGDDDRQVVGRVEVVDAAIGVIQFNLDGNVAIESVGGRSITPGSLSADALGHAIVADDFFTTAEMVAGAGGKFAPGALDNVGIANVVADDAFTAAEFAVGVGGKFAANCLNTEAVADNFVAAGTLGEDRLVAAQLTQRANANSAELAAGAIPIASIGNAGVLALAIPVQVGAANVDFTLPAGVGIRVIDAWAVNTSGAAGVHTMTVQNGATAITNAIDTDKADQTITRAGTINDAAGAHFIAGGGTLRVAVSAASDSVIMYVAYLRFAA